MGNSYYTEKELNEIGFKNIGKEVYISKKASIYGAENITIGSYVRIDDFCILSGNIAIGSFVHIAAYSALYGGKGEGIVLEDFVTLSSRNAVYAATDDYYGNGLSNPLLGDEFRNVYEKKVVLEKHVLIGTGCTILPGVTIHEGTSVGAMSLIKCDIEEWGVYVGVPSRRIANREKKVQELEQKVYSSIYRNVN